MGGARWWHGAGMIACWLGGGAACEGRPEPAEEPSGDLGPPSPCVARTCEGEGAECGPVDDGCGGTLWCGECGVGMACGVETKNSCGPVCVPTSCEALGYQCGRWHDGCGGWFTCGLCAQGDTCDSEGICQCQPAACAEGQCGNLADGCGGELACGGCLDGEACDPTTHACVCQPAACAEGQCGSLADGCGGQLACGGCPPGETCDEQHQCKCAPSTCESLGWECGAPDDGCGGVLACGACVPASGGASSCIEGGCVETCLAGLPCAGGPLGVVTTSPLGVASVGAAYTLTLAVTGGTGPYAWNLEDGALPPGITLAGDGTLGGTPTAAGSFGFSVQVTDAYGVSADQPLTLLVTGTLLSSLATDGSFEAGLASWTQLGKGAGVQYAVVADATEGASAVRVTNRAQVSHAPAQNAFSSLLAGAAGTPLTTRFWVKLDAPGMARCVLKLTADPGDGPPATTMLILAEEVVRTADLWVEVRGTATLVWNGTLTGASLEFSIGQPAELVAPGLTLDDLRVERDADADGLPDGDESAGDATTADRDHDGLPDGWEVRHAQPGLLDPEVADADLDADADGYTNRQEYWTATLPLDAASIPGVPSVAGASAQLVAITHDLALLPTLGAGRVVSGQHITGGLFMGGLAGEYADNVQALFDATGKWPGLLSLQYEGAETSIGPLQVDLVNPYALEWAAAGGLVLIKFQPFDPWTLAASGSSGSPHVDLLGLLDPAAGDPADIEANTAAQALWLAWLDQMATGLDELQQAGVVVLWRPLSEMNNASHWQSRQPREAWIALWRHMHDYFTETRGLQNLLWVYEADSFAHAIVPADYYYPGDDVVDLMGHNLYDDDWVLPYDLDALFRRYPKIYGFPQAGSQSVRDGTWDNLTMTDGIAQRFPRASLFCTWNDFYTAGGTVWNARSMVGQYNEAALLDHPWVLTRDELPY